MTARALYYQVEEVVRAYTFVRELALETIIFLREMKNIEPEQRSIFERDEYEMLELISQLDTEFQNEIIRIQRDSRHVFQRNE